MYIDQFKFIGGTFITFLGTITAWVSATNMLLSMVASIVAILVGIATFRTLLNRLKIQELDQKLKTLQIEEMHDHKSE